MNSVANKLRAYAELGRISNLPTTLTNVMVGCAIGANAITTGDLARVSTMFLVWLPIACFYLGGMALNDLLDAKVDATERPQRPIPSGRVSQREAVILIAVLFVAGLVVLGTFNVIALALGIGLVAVIILYDVIHATTAASVLLLGAARGMIYVIAATAIAPHGEWPHIKVLAGALVAYTIAFSLIARREMQPQARTLRYVAEALPFIAIAPIFLIAPSHGMWIVYPAALALIWISYAVGMYMLSPERTGQAVMMWIAGLCLIDALYLFALEQAHFAGMALICFILTSVAQRRIAGT